MKSYRALLILLSLLVILPASGCDVLEALNPVVFADAQVEATIRNIIGKQTGGDITAKDMLGISGMGCPIRHCLVLHQSAFFFLVK